MTNPRRISTNSLNLGFPSMLDFFNVSNQQESKFPFSNVYIDYEDDGIDKQEYIVFELALAGYKKSDIDIEVKEGFLTVSCSQSNSLPKENVKYIEKGIAKRDFIKRWAISSSIDIHSGAATMKDGILKIEFLVNSQGKNSIKIA